MSMYMHSQFLYIYIYISLKSTFVGPDALPLHTSLLIECTSIFLVQFGGFLSRASLTHFLIRIPTFVGSFLIGSSTCAHSGILASFAHLFSEAPLASDSSSSI
jgi:hypothetical protein